MFRDPQLIPRPAKRVSRRETRVDPQTIRGPVLFPSPAIEPRLLRANDIIRDGTKLNRGLRSNRKLRVAVPTLVLLLLLFLSLLLLPPGASQILPAGRPRI